MQIMPKPTKPELLLPSGQFLRISSRCCNLSISSGGPRLLLMRTPDRRWAEPSRRCTIGNEPRSQTSRIPSDLGSVDSDR